MTDLPSGARVRWGYDFDRNALKAMAVSGGAVVALSASGNLLRFDRATLKLTAERVGPGVVRSLGSGPDGAVLAGLALGPVGRVVRVDPETLALAPLEDVDAPPVWVGADERGAWAVVERLAWRQGRTADGRDFRVRDASHEAVDFAGRSRVKLPHEGTTFLLDRKHRLWVGGDYGEFGSWVGAVDVNGKAGPLLEPAGKFEGVFGFFEREGEVFAFGGLSHAGSSGGYVARCADARVSKVADFNVNLWLSREPDRSRPFAPITHLFAGRAGGEMLALSSGSLFRVGPTFSKWTKLRDVSIREGGGGRVAPDDYRGVRGAWRGDEGSLLLATRHDGLLRLSGNETERASLQGQLEAGPIDGIAFGPEGALLLGGGSAFARSGRTWGKVAGAPENDGEGAEAYNKFRTPDGALFGTNGEHLVRLEGGAWKRVVQLQHSGARFKAVGEGGPPWVLLDAGSHRLFRLDPARGTLDPILATDQAGDLPVEDALPWANGRLLVATWRGLYELPASGGVAAPSPLAAPPDVFRMARDGRGRLWLGGEGLWVHDLARGRLHVLDEVPGVGRRSVAAMAPDRARQGGVVVAFDDERESPSGGASVAFLAIDPD